MVVVALAVIAVAVAAVSEGALAHLFGVRDPVSPLRQRIVAEAQGQLGYTTDPAGTYCNEFSAYWGTGADDCGNANLDEQWCADFAAWAWRQAGAAVTYSFEPGDVNSSSASFYQWAVAHGTWHAAGSSYVPQPGDVAVYGLDTTRMVAQHVAVVTGYQPGARGPDVVNGDGSRTGFSAVEAGTDQYQADVHGAGGSLSGYASPLPASS